MDISLLFPVLILLLFIPIFLSGRKQKRALAQTQEMQSALDTGDVVVTTSGLRATVVDASYEETIDLEIADGVVTTWLRAAVREKVDPTPEDFSTPGELAGSDDLSKDVTDTTAGPDTTDTTPTDSSDTPGADGRSNGRS
ncbi:MAG: preprotein translocase subunit YajC [Pseudonocardia sp.]|nr:preprotein translocase subunit YajC [Pseudonocardia sp.]